MFPYFKEVLYTSKTKFVKKFFGFFHGRSCHNFVQFRQQDHALESHGFGTIFRIQGFQELLEVFHRVTGPHLVQETDLIGRKAVDLDH